MLLPRRDKDQDPCCAAPGMVCNFACGKRLCLHLHLTNALLCLSLLSLLILEVRGILQYNTPASASHLTSTGAEAGRLHSKKRSHLAHFIHNAATAHEKGHQATAHMCCFGDIVARARTGSKEKAYRLTCSLSTFCIPACVKQRLSLNQWIPRSLVQPLGRVADYHLGICEDCAILRQWGVVGRQIHVLYRAGCPGSLC